MSRQLTRDPQPDHTVRWWCQGCDWDISQSPASYQDVRVAFFKHVGANNRIGFRRGGE